MKITDIYTRLNECCLFGTQINLYYKEIFNSIIITVINVLSIKGEIIRITCKAMLFIENDDSNTQYYNYFKSLSHLVDDDSPYILISGKEVKCYIDEGSTVKDIKFHIIEDNKQKRKEEIKKYTKFNRFEIMDI